MLEHGGDLHAAIRRFGHARGHWLDLSTGINPHAYPVPPLPAECWHRLPEADDPLLEAARRYYGTQHLLPVAGSQAAIQALPALIGGARVGLLTPSYSEHEHAWRPHAPRLLRAEAIDAAVDTLDTLLLVNPNNPTGERFARAQLRDWHARLASRGGTLVVDEAFADTEPGDSLAAEAGVPGLWVLRSLGKFFGLAGARVGFALGPPDGLARLDATLGPWTLGGPARFAARCALADRVWQDRMRATLAAEGARLAALLARHGAGAPAGTALFCWLRAAQARQWQAHLAQQAIWVRAFDDPAALRFGLPGDESGWTRLDAALAEGRRTGLHF